MGALESLYRDPSGSTKNACSDESVWPAFSTTTNTQRNFKLGFGDRNLRFRRRAGETSGSNNGAYQETPETMEEVHYQIPRHNGNIDKIRANSSLHHTQEMGGVHETLVFSHTNIRGQKERTSNDGRLQRNQPRTNTSQDSGGDKTSTSDPYRAPNHGTHKVHDDRNQGSDCNDMGICGEIDLNHGPHEIGHQGNESGGRQRGVPNDHIQIGKDYLVHKEVHTHNARAQLRSKLHIRFTTRDFPEGHRPVLYGDKEKPQALLDERVEKGSCPTPGSERDNTRHPDAHYEAQKHRVPVFILGRRIVCPMGDIQNSRSGDVEMKRRFIKNPWTFEKSLGGPLYAPSVPVLNWNKLASMAELAGIDKQSIHAVNRFVSDASFRRCETATRIPQSQVEDSVLSQLLANGQIARAHPSALVTTVFFLVSETRKTGPRRRTIFNTVADNELGPTLATMKVASLNLVSARLRVCKFAATRDFKSYFNQIGLSLAVSNCYVFSNRGSKYRLTRAAMGNTNSPAIATNITTIIVMIALGRHKRDFPDSKIKYDIIIDDVLFAADCEHALSNVLLHFDQICREVNVTVSTETNINTTITHRGAVFDLIKQNVCLKPAFVDKFRSRAIDFDAKPNLSKARSLIGSIAYAAAIIDIDPSPSYRQFATMLLSGSHTVPRQTFTNVIQAIIENKPKPLECAENVPSAGLVCADATPTKIAGFFLSSDDVLYQFEKLTEFTIIHLNEAGGTLGALNLVPKFRVTHSVDIFTDNQSWLGSVSNTSRGTTPELEVARGTFWHMCREKNILPKIRYIASASNPADIMSRQECYQLNKDEIRQAIKAVPDEGGL
jgi:hypothetical protein